VSGPGIAVVGSLNRDYTCVVDHLPAPGETVGGQELVVASGGKGANQAVAAALAGAAHEVVVAMVGAVGADPDGEVLLEELRQAGVLVDEVAVLPDRRSGAALITVRSDGENTIVVAPGANRAVAPQAVAAALLRRSAAVVLVSAEVPTAIVGTAVRHAASTGARPVLNLAPYADLPPDLLALCDPLVVNESEAGSLLDRRVDAGADLSAAAGDLATLAASAVLTAGAQGAYVADRQGVRHVPAPQVPVVDTTGAGDAFTGALAAALALGHPLVGAASWGVAAGARSVQQRGARLRLPAGLRLADEV
jgi:ribokinase